MLTFRTFVDRVYFFLWMAVCGIISIYTTYFFASSLPKNLGFSKQLTFIYDSLLLVFDYTLSDIDALIIAISLPMIELSSLCALFVLLSMWLSKKIALRFLRSPF